MGVENMCNLWLFINKYYKKNSPKHEFAHESIYFPLIRKRGYHEQD